MKIRQLAAAAVGVGVLGMAGTALAIPITPSTSPTSPSATTPAPLDTTSGITTDTVAITPDTVGGVTTGTTAGTGGTAAEPTQFCSVLVEYAGAALEVGTALQASTIDAAVADAAFGRVSAAAPMLKQSAPADLSGDVTKVVDAALALFDIVKRHNYNEADLQKSPEDVAAATAIINDTSVGAASSRLDTYRTTTCNVPGDRVAFCALAHRYNADAGAISAALQATPADAAAATAAWTDMQPLPEQLKSTSPADIKDLLTAVLDAQSKLLGIIANYGFDQSKIPAGSADDTTLTQISQDPTLASQITQINTWGAANCAIIPD